MKRKLATSSDFTQVKMQQNRNGEIVEINPVDNIVKVGLIKDRANLVIDDYMIEFEGLYEEQDIGQGIFIRDDSITDADDLGVIITVNGYKYRRQYIGPVYLDWFGEDYLLGLKNAIKYNYIKCLPKIYNIEVEKITSFLITNNVEIDGNGSIFTITHPDTLLWLFTFNFNKTIDYFIWNYTKFEFTINTLFKFNREYNVGYLDFYSYNLFPWTLTDTEYNITMIPATNGILINEMPAKITGQWTFTSVPKIIRNTLLENDFVRLKDLSETEINENVMVKNINQTITGNKTILNISYPNATADNELATLENWESVKFNLLYSIRNYVLQKYYEIKLGSTEETTSLFPIGFVYLQFINTSTRQFEELEAPTYLFGGTWEVLDTTYSSFANSPGDTIEDGEETFVTTDGASDDFVVLENPRASIPRHIPYKRWKRTA